MIGLLSGEVASIETSSILLDVNGVGYEVHMTGSDISTLRLGREITVFTHLALSQDSVALYGFVAKQSKTLFLQLQKVSGVGPKAALSLLSALPGEALLTAISHQDVTALTKAPGIGRKGAQKIILELSGSMAHLEDDSVRGQNGEVMTAEPHAREVVEGLISLGWQQRDAQEAVRAIRAQREMTGDFERDEIPDVLRAALAYLGKGK